MGWLRGVSVRRAGEDLIVDSSSGAGDPALEGVPAERGARVINSVNTQALPASTRHRRGAALPELAVSLEARAKGASRVVGHGSLVGMRGSVKFKGAHTLGLTLSARGTTIAPEPHSPRTNHIARGEGAKKGSYWTPAGQSDCT